MSKELQAIGEAINSLSSAIRAKDKKGTDEWISFALGHLSSALTQKDD